MSRQRRKACQALERMRSGVVRRAGDARTIFDRRVRLEPLESRLLNPGEPRRLYCTACEFVFYLDPKVAACTICRTEAGIVLTGTEIKQVNVDTTVQEKAIAFPTDARLYHKARQALVRVAQSCNF